MEKISTLERFEALGVMPIDDRPESGADEVERRIRTRIRPCVSISDSVRSFSRPSREMTSASTSNLAMDAAVGPGNWFCINTVAALYSKRKSNNVYLQNKMSKFILKSSF